jgi:transketolase N-terminal domain/subunit
MSNILTLDEMHNMNIDDIVGLYRNGYIIEENLNEKNSNDTNLDNLNPKIVSADVSISTGSLFLLGAAILLYMYIKR